ncbi:Sugar transporter, conserved site,Major facilitator superfamily domain,Major facilitator, sugar [Cinara cedri]|uniref:Sugar transporter, conserved site,Major facilitator superfamily domain,Major facilitator, sugar n=1 Tax=Cinara cedri TaxID=506608 RepID=A0A5E4NEN0_9HEMI|nr:Sugar transporter, conserved site,Major facilitator superfamily domain,Major facilitator, sugar [Cinara cedri]
MYFKLNIPPVFKQMFAASGPLIVTLSSGMTVGFSAVLLPQLKNDRSAIRIDSHQESWIASMAALPMAVGSVLGGISMDKLGRKTTNMLICVPFVLGWTAVSLANDVEGVYVGRLLTGLCTGLLGPPSAVYIAEVTEQRYRGAALAMISFSVSAGILIVHTMGTFLDWRLVSALCSVIPFAGYALIWFTPESPVWLLDKGRAESAERAKWRLTAATSRALSTDKPQRPPATSSPSGADATVAVVVGKPSTCQCFTRASFLMPLIVLSAFFFIQQFSGVNTVAFYSVTLLKRISPDLNEYHCTMALDVIRLAVSVMACGLTKKYNRRSLAIVSAIGTCLSLLCLAVSVSDTTAAAGAQETVIAAAAVHAVPTRPKGASLTPILSIVSYMVFVNIGLVPLPWIMSGEMFPAYCRELGSGLSTCFGFVMFYVVIQISPYMLATVGTSMTFYIFGTVSGAGAVFLYLCLPETKNKTLDGGDAT